MSACLGADEFKGYLSGHRTRIIQPQLMLRGAYQSPSSQRESVCLFDYHTGGPRSRLGKGDLMEGLRFL